MASNLSTIGFAFTSGEEMAERLVPLAETADRRLAAPCGDYGIWRSRSGAELWFHLAPHDGTADTPRVIEGLTPFFEGESDVTLDDLAPFTRPGDNAFEGAIQAHVGTDIDGGGVPLVFDAVDFATLAAAITADDGALDSARFRLVAFARELQSFADEDAYYASNAGDDDQPVFAAVSFVPVGMFAAAEAANGGGEPQPPSSQALVNGRVAATRLLTNEATGRTFHWLVVETLGMTIDVVADPAVVTGDPVAGGTVAVAALLFGRRLG